MSLPIPWKWLHVSSILMGLFTLGALPVVNAHDSRFEQPGKILKEHRQNILQLFSDEEALKFNQRFMPQLRQLQHSHTHRKPSRDKSIPISQEMQTTITTFWAAMVIIGYIQELRVEPEAPLAKSVFSEFLSSDIQHQWLLSKSSLKGFKHLLEFQKKLSMGTKQKLPDLPSDNDYSQFAKFHDQPSSNSGRQIWVSLLNELGFQGIQDRLHEYWQQGGRHHAQHAASDSQKRAYVQHYIESKLLPIFHTHLLTQAIQVEAQAYTVAWESWHRIQQWQEQEQTYHAMRRLCGTWKWMIHNHQNHGDHKTTMTFIPPGKSTSSQAQPTTILIHGDTVYLKWTFPQGTQEDSLLLSNRDTRLEGTFLNSLGPHGSISGQRLSSCEN